MIRESDVQQAIEVYFTKAGFTCKHEKLGVDLIVSRSGNIEWIIEAKGETSSPNERTDFCTCIGQLVCSIKDSDKKYGIAVPNTKKYIRQVNYLSTYIRQLLNLYILLVDVDGKVEIFEPSSIHIK